MSCSAGACRMTEVRLPRSGSYTLFPAFVATTTHRTSQGSAFPSYLPTSHSPPITPRLLFRSPMQRASREGEAEGGGDFIIHRRSVMMENRSIALPLKGENIG